MKLFSHASIQRKLILITMTITTVALLVACAGLAGYEVLSFRQSMVSNISTLAEITGNNAAGALDFNDPTAAKETLSALSAEPHIAGACLYTSKGTLFATYGANFHPPPHAPPAGYAFGKNALTLARPVSSKGDVVGTIYIDSDLAALYARLARYAVILAAAFGFTVLVALTLSRRLQTVVSQPIVQLGRAARAAGEQKDYSVRVAKQYPDEIGDLVDCFNTMIAQIQERDANLEKRVAERTLELEKLHRELVDASRKAGMAEVATSVLHNVGNVLNSVNVSTTLIVDTLAASKSQKVQRLATLIAEHKENLPQFFATDRKAAQVPAYLEMLATELEKERTKLKSEAELTRKNIDHIKTIVSMQQGYAKFNGLIESVSPVELFEDALRLNESALRVHEIRVFRQFPPATPNITAEKHKILQILVNLIRNARFACEESGREEKAITLNLQDNGQRVQFNIIDNGIGIPPENLKRIFNHGFTTRRTGHGFGLHSGALAAQEMGGSLTVFSEGSGEGARFTLDLPLEAPPSHGQN